jgi:hypothetical protein
VEALRALVAAGALMNHADSNGCTALYTAAANGELMQ